MDSRKRKLNIILISAAASAVLLAGLYFYLLYVVRSNQNEILQKSMLNLSELENIQSNYSLYNKALEETQEERKDLDSFIVNKKSAADFISDIEKFAEHAGVQITKSVTLEKASPQAKDSFLHFSVRAKGDIDDVFYFMLLEENMPYKLRFKKFAIAMSDAGGNSSLASVPVQTKTSKGKTVVAAPIPKPEWTGEADFELLSYINE